MFHRITSSIAAMAVATLVFAVSGCSKPSKGPENTATAAPAAPADVKALKKQVKRMDRRLKKIEKLLAQYLNQPPEPDPKAVYSVPVEGDPYKGAKNAPVTVIKGFEFGCPYCFHAAATMTKLLADYKDKIRIVYKYFLVHDVALQAGLAACAANKQGKFPEFEPKVWHEGFEQRDLSADKMKTIAKELKLDMAQFQKDVGSKDCKDWLRKSQKELAAVGTTGTPAFYINGRYLSGAQPIENFKKVIDEEMAKANTIIAKGTPVADYYKKYVVEKGLHEVKKPDEDED